MSILATILIDDNIKDDYTHFFHAHAASMGIQLVAVKGLCMNHNVAEVTIRVNSDSFPQLQQRLLNISYGQMRKGEWNF